MIKTTVIALLVSAVVLGCGERSSLQSAPVTELTVATDTIDPYERYLSLAPEDAPDLSRDDALARAMLGCEIDWPKGTTDWALAVAYRPTLRC